MKETHIRNCRKRIRKCRHKFGGSPEKLKAESLDVYERVYAEVISTDRFVGQVDMTRGIEVKAEEIFSITA